MLDIFGRVVFWACSHVEPPLSYPPQPAMEAVYVFPLQGGVGRMCMWCCTMPFIIIFSSTCPAMNICKRPLRGVWREPLYYTCTHRTLAAYTYVLYILVYVFVSCTGRFQGSDWTCIRCHLSDTSHVLRDNEVGWVVWRPPLSSFSLLYHRAPMNSAFGMCNWC